MTNIGKVIAGKKKSKKLDAEKLVFGFKSEVFKMVIPTFLKDTNAYGNIYFSRQFEWQGICREAWFAQEIFSDMLEIRGSFITKSSHLDFLHETKPFDVFEAHLTVFNLKRYSLCLNFEFYAKNDGRKVSEGYQKIGYKDDRNKISRFPDVVTENAIRFLRN